MRSLCIKRGPPTRVMTFIAAKRRICLVPLPVRKLGSLHRVLPEWPAVSVARRAPAGFEYRQEKNPPEPGGPHWFQNPPEPGGPH